MGSLFWRTIKVWFSDKGSDSPTATLTVGLFCLLSYTIRVTSKKLKCVSPACTSNLLNEPSIFCTLFLSLMINPLHWLKPKYINPNTKTQNISCRLNENLTTFLYTLTGATRKQKEKKKFSLLKCIKKSNVIKKRIWVLVFGFMYLVLVDAMD